mmetsp:Transcript_24433/g.34160  ORF Transcript_24433/g.34160 Transcript_24433/m.34160 type:complete len:274 (+) Transcript_24433:116-937(+)
MLVFFAIAMPNRIERLKAFAESHGIALNIVDGVNVHTLNHTALVESEEIKMRYCMPTLAVALVKGHQAAVKAFLNSDYEYGMIFEDDVTLDKNTASEYGTDSIPTILNDIAMTSRTYGWDYLNLGRCIDNCESERVVFEGVRGKDVKLIESSNPMCANAYMVTRRGAEVLLQNTSPIFNPWDVMPLIMHKASRKGEFKVLSTSPRLFDQDRENTGSAFHHDMNLECSPVDGPRFAKQQYQLTRVAGFRWTDGELQFSGKELNCPAFVQPDKGT